MPVQLRLKGQRATKLALFLVLTQPVCVADVAIRDDMFGALDCDRPTVSTYVYSKHRVEPRVYKNPITAIKVLELPILILTSNADSKTQNEFVRSIDTLGNSHFDKAHTMLFSRIASLILRIAQFAFAAIVLGLTAYFLYQHTRHDDGPLGRLIFTTIWSSLSVIMSVIWAVPTSSSMTGYMSDLVFTAGWAAVFALYVRYFNRTGCGDAWNWSGVSFSRTNSCGQWRAAQAFSFLSLVLWFATFVLGVITVHRIKRRAAARGRSQI